LVITMIMWAGVQGYAQPHHRHHRPIYRPYYYGYYYSPYYYGGSRVYVDDGYGVVRRVYAPTTVVVESPVYSTTTRSTVKSEENAELKLDGVTIERESTNRLHVKGGKANVTLDTSKANLHVVTTKLGSITVQTTGDGSAKISVQHGDKIVGTYNL